MHGRRHQETGMNLTPVFNQYLRFTGIPSLDLRIVKKKLEFRWRADAPDFNMPVDIVINDVKTRLEPTTEWEKSNITIERINTVEVLKDLSRNVTGHGCFELSLHLGFRIEPL